MGGLVGWELCARAEFFSTKTSTVPTNAVVHYVVSIHTVVSCRAEHARILRVLVVWMMPWRWPL